MIEVLLILCAAIWVPVLLHQIAHRGFLILLIWLFIAPIATNLVQGRSNPFFTIRQDRQDSMQRAANVQGPIGTITLRDLLEPTRILLGAFVFVFLLGTILRKKPLVPLDRTEIWMSIFSLVLVANVLLQTTRIAFGLRTATDAFIVPFLGYYVTRRLVTSEDRFRQLTQVLGYMGSYVIILCLLERLANPGVTHRVVGPFVGSAALHVALTAVLYAAVQGKEFFSRGVYRFVVYLAPVITLLTWGRGYWVGFLSGVWVFALLGRRFISSSLQMRAIGVILTVIPIIVVSALVLGPVEVIEGQEAIAGRVGNVDTANWRLERWEAALRIGFDSPIFGIGLDNSRAVFVQLLGGRGVTSHNSFLSLFAELGTIGLLAYLAIVASIVRMGLRLYWMGPHSRDRWRGICVIAAMAAYQSAAFFITLLYATQLSHVYVYVFAGGIAGLYGRSNHALNAFSGNHQRMPISGCP